MEDSDDTLSARIEVVRCELKAWERSFALRNEGRKATRDEIKANADIASKYKEYNKLKGTAADIIKPPKQDLALTATPQKRSRHGDLTGSQTCHDDNIGLSTKRKIPSEAETPRKRSKFTENLDASITPSRHSVTPVFARAFIDPTPQRDGRVLGIFDLLSDSPVKTPTKTASCTTVQDARVVLGDVDGNRISRTPMKSDLTPSKFKSPEAQKTPMFLRRVSQREPPLRQPGFRKLGRSLSTMIAEMRQAEDAEHDDELDVLREMEAEAAGRPIAPKRAVIISNSQGVDLPLGPDRTHDSDDEDEATTHIPQQGARVWKKKGAKRQTRRVLLRPTHKRPQDTSESSFSVSADVEVVHETQNQSDIKRNSTQESLEPELDSAERPHKRPRAEAGCQVEVESKTAASIVQKAVRKVSSLAHANFRKLKIRGNGASGKSRFGRRR